jgi:hypothetical protein
MEAGNRMKRSGIAISLMLTVVTGTAIAMHMSRTKPPAMPTITLLRTPHEGTRSTAIDPTDGALAAAP